MKGLFITFEGGEGSGKSTMIRRLTEHLKSEGCIVTTTREPGGTPLGEQIRHWVLDHDETINVGDHAELLLFLAARSQHLEEVIIPALKKGDTVLCDRFNDSSVAYQGVARGLGKLDVEKMCAITCRGIIPDTTFYLDVDPNIGLARMTGEVDRIETEKVSFHDNVRQAFLTLAHENTDRIHIIDASKTEDEVFAEILTYVSS